MRLQLDRNLEESNEHRRKLDLGARDNKRLQDDLLSLSRENQVNYLKRVLKCIGIKICIPTPLLQP